MDDKEFQELKSLIGKDSCCNFCINKPYCEFSSSSMVICIKTKKGKEFAIKIKEELDKIHYQWKHGPVYAIQYFILKDGDWKTNQSNRFLSKEEAINHIHSNANFYSRRIVKIIENKEVEICDNGLEY